MNCLWGTLIVDELIRQGVEYFCLAPGSRSSPLALAVAKNPRARSFIHYDERGLAFHALGWSAATKRPCVIITTSGTAVANLLPAVVEASKKKLPLIILTADRPPELRDTGAMQTIHQPGIFGKYVRWHFDLPCPTQDIEPSFVLTTVDQAIHRARASVPGPVHLNCMYRDPLPGLTTAPAIQNSGNLKDWAKSNRPYTAYLTAQPLLSREKMARISREIRKIKKGVIVVGKLADAQEGRAALELSKRLNWPLFPDISSGLRLGNKHKNVIPYYDQILSSREFCEKNTFDGVVHLGGRITSKRWYEYIEKSRPRHYIMVLKHPLRHDPLHNVTLRIESGIGAFCQAVHGSAFPQRRSQDIRQLKKISAAVDAAITEFMTKRRKLNEPTVARLISRYIPKQTALFLANSMPVRYMDMFACGSQHPVRVEGNRGASGIDGTIASATGFARGIKRPVTLLVGDLAFLHDLNSLRMLTALKIPVVIVVLNNNGGGIFSFLPVAQSPEAIFEKYFAAPHHLQFSLAARMFSIHYAQPKTQNQFTAEYNMAFVRKKPTIIEINTDRKMNHKFHEDLQNKIRTAVNDTQSIYK